MNPEEFQEILRMQQMMSQRLMQEQQVDREIDIMNIVNELSNNGRKRIQTEAILIEAAQQNIGEREALSLLDALERDNFIRRSRTGFVEVV